MNVAVEEKGLLRTLTIEDEGQEIKDLVNSVLKEVSKNVSLPGFRKGHVPPSIIKAKYKDAINEEVAKKYINKHLPEILKEKDLAPVSPNLDLGEIKIENDSKLSFKVRFEVAPEFELKDYEGLEIEMIKYEVSDEDVEKAIQRLLEENAKYETEDKAIEEGDLVKLHYKITDEKGNTEEDEIEAIIGANQLRKEIEDELKGKKVGDKIHLENVPLYNEKGEEFGKATVDIEVLEVKKKIVPEFNDEFVKELGLGENLEEAKKKIKEDLEKQVKEAKEAELKQKILDKLAEQYDFEVPTSLVQAELEVLLQNYMRQLEQFGVKPNQDMLMAAAQGLEATAIKNVKLAFILNKIADKEGIEVTDEELNQEIEKMAQEYQISPQQMKQIIEEQGALAGIKYNLLRDKVLDLLKEKVKIVEMTKEEYEAKYGKVEGQPLEETKEVEEKQEETNEQK
ncbi:trigger factor [Hydrogenothermus marinus]|uniref:Trigger factor n=1 Tax=Hydrogenothermus marinus TaxID=133270 RepID=A0A3M0BQ30_9AQUI|nr:trigger factor [Hydrogenothermus marinus]RMA93032.1 trigger factor [Hydrogenothermus marinus]